MAPSPGPRIEALLAALRMAGLGGGVVGSLRVAEVLRALARDAGLEPRPIDLEALRDLLRCVLASSMEERATFDRVFAAWRDTALVEIASRAPSLQEAPERPPAPLPARVEPRRPARWIPRLVAAAAIGGLLSAGVAAWRFWPTGFGGVESDAGARADAAVFDEPDAGVANQRPTTFRAREIVFTIEPSPAQRSLPWQIALTLLAAGAAGLLVWVVRNRRWLPKALAPPSVAGPPEVPPLPIGEGPRIAGLFTSSERDDLAFAVDRFIREEPSPEIDAHRTIDATIAAGGRAEVVFRPRVENRTVWLWTDEASSSPLVARFAGEVASSLAAAGLPSERGRFSCVPDRVDVDAHGALAPHEVDDAAQGSAVLLVTDGEGLARRLGDSASRGWVRPLLRVLSRWPRVAFVAVADEGRRALMAAFARFDVGVEVIAPEDVQAFLAGNEARREPRAPARLVGDTLAWAAGCCLSERALDAAEALALRGAMKLDAPVWHVEAVLADVAGASGASAAAKERRADRLRWLAQVSGPKGGPLGAALRFHRDRLEAEDAERVAQDAEDPWIDTPAQRGLRRQMALLDLWTTPDDALVRLHELHPEDDSTRHLVLDGYAAGASRVELRAEDGIIGLPWSMADLDTDQSRLLAQELGLQIIGEARWKKAVPGRALMAAGVAAGLVVGVGVGAVAKWVKQPTGLTGCVNPAGGWCDVLLGDTGITLAGGIGRVQSSTRDFVFGASYRVTQGAEMRFACRSKVSAETAIQLCGRRESPLPRGPDWRMRYSLGVVLGEDNDPDREAWADALLDSGTADRVIVTSDGGRLNLDHSPLYMPEVQAIVVDLKGGSKLIHLPEQWAVAKLVPKPGGPEREALSGTEVRSVAETWGNAKILSGQPQLAGVAVGMAQVDAGAAPAEPTGPIHHSSECPYREVEDNGLVFVRVCGGTFQMGSKKDDSMAHDDEKPEHTVTVSTFWMGRYEVSNAEYRKLVPDHGSGESDDRPAMSVSWADAEKMCASRGHRLPTEAEWEYAARGPEGRRYPWGEAQPTDKIAVFGPRNAVPVKSFLEVGSPFGTAHQAGNVWEWVEDCYDSGLYQKRAGRTTVDPLNVDCPASGDRVLRGGSFGFFPGLLRSADRNNFRRGDRGWFVGFRCVRGPRRQR